jgi:hypothetical protein
MAESPTEAFGSLLTIPIILWADGLLAPAPSGVPWQHGRAADAAGRGGA